MFSVLESQNESDWKCCMQYTKVLNCLASVTLSWPQMQWNRFFAIFLRLTLNKQFFSFWVLTKIWIFVHLKKERVIAKSISSINQIGATFHDDYSVWMHIKWKLNEFLSFAWVKINKRWDFLILIISELANIEHFANFYSGSTDFSYL